MQACCTALYNVESLSHSITREQTSTPHTALMIALPHKWMSHKLTVPHTQSDQGSCKIWNPARSLSLAQLLVLKGGGSTLRTAGSGA